MKVATIIFYLLVGGADAFGFRDAWEHLSSLLTDTLGDEEANGSEKRPAAGVWGFLSSVVSFLTGDKDDAGRRLLGHATVSFCQSKNGGKTCRFDGSAFSFRGGSIALKLEELGQEIRCSGSSSNGVGWHGECDGESNDANFIERFDNGIAHVYGSIRMGSDICQVFPDAEGEEQISCRSEDMFDDEEEPLDGDADEEEEESPLGRTLVDENVTFAMSHVNNRLGRRRLYDDSGKTLDILVVWTNLAECGRSKLTKGCVLTNTTEANMRGLIDLAIEETNTAFELSGVNTKLRLVHAYRDPDYVEPTSNIWNTMIGNLKSKYDRQLDSVHANRTLYGADLVGMIAGSPGSCGIAYTGPHIDKTYFVTSHSCAVRIFSA